MSSNEMISKNEEQKLEIKNHILKTLYNYTFTNDKKSQLERWYNRS